VNARNISYAIGYDIGRKFEQREVDIDPDALAAGLRAQQTKSTGRLTEKQINEVLNSFRDQLRRQRAKQKQSQAKQNQRRGKQFLRKNRQRPDVSVTSSGLQYKVIEQGSGRAPGPKDEVTVHYEGKLLDGTVFDSSRKRGGRPATFRVDKVIDGWTEALQRMKPGAKWRLWIPADLAYGQRGMGDTIEPGQTLVFTVELLDVAEQNGN